MPIEYHIAHGQYLVFNAAGAITGNEILKANEWLYSEFPEDDLARFQLWDFSSATVIKVDIDKIRKMAEQDKRAAQSLARLVIACVAPGDLFYGLSRMWQALADDAAIDAHVFRDRPSAEAWMLAKIEQVTPYNSEH
jgi:hypothetical protein